MTRIFVIDERPDFVALIRHLLAANEMVIDATSGAEAAFAILSKRSIDMVVSARNVAERDELLREIRTLYPGVEALALTTAVGTGASSDGAGLASKMLSTAPAELANLTYRQALSQLREHASREYLRAVLEAVRGNVTQAAERAGVERESLHRLLKQFGLRAEDFRGKSP